jgi:D-arabinose 1-dehydrogenase-like Zn-dependent alcohol dehydrogenase
VGNGTSVVIIGAGGAVGSLATQLAVMRGARVIAAVKPQDAASVRAFAPQQTIASSVAGEIIRGVSDAFPDGVEAVLDFVSDGETLKALASMLSQDGTIVTTTHVADDGWFAARGLHAVNFVLANAPECSPAGLDELTALLAAGKLHIAIRDECPLDEAQRVLDQSEQHALRGKHVIRPTALR